MIVGAARERKETPVTTALDPVPMMDSLRQRRGPAPGQPAPAPVYAIEPRLCVRTPARPAALSDEGQVGPHSWRSPMQLLLLAKLALVIWTVAALVGLAVTSWLEIRELAEEEI